LTISELVNQFNTRFPDGFLPSEIEDILKNYPSIDRMKFDNSLEGVTCIIRDNQNVYRHIDIELALYFSLGNNSSGNFEWD